MKRFTFFRNGRMLPLLALLVLAAASGCGGRKTYPVEGKVVFKDGTPLTGGRVEFESVTPGGKRLNARGLIQPDGSFCLSTFREGDGAVEGPHRVLVRPPFTDSTRFNEGVWPRPLIHPRFQSYEGSRLRLNVGPGDNRFTILVDKP